MQITEFLKIINFLFLLEKRIGVDIVKKILLLNLFSINVVCRNFILITMTLGIVQILFDFQFH